MLRRRDQNTAGIDRLEWHGQFVFSLAGVGEMENFYGHFHHVLYLQAIKQLLSEDNTQP